MRAQLARYRALGRRARLLERTPKRMLVQLDDNVDAAMVEEVIALERECCPFFTIEWQSESRRLAVAVSAAEHEPALGAIAFALDVKSRS